MDSNCPLAGKVLQHLLADMSGCLLNNTVCHDTDCPLSLGICIPTALHPNCVCMVVFVSRCSWLKHALLSQTLKVKQDKEFASVCSHLIVDQ